MRLRVRPVAGLTGAIEVPGDKSISHRAALLGAIASGPTEVWGYLEAEDCLRTLRAIEKLGVEVTRKGPGHYRIAGVGLTGLQEPDSVLECGNSGTTARLLLGVLAGQPFWSMLTGDDSLRRRPMARVATPLRQMGATIVGRDEGTKLPLAVRGARPLSSLTYRIPIASAQVKSAVLLAGLWADAPVVVEEPSASRDHSERMLRQFGARLSVDGNRITLVPGSPLAGCGVQVPGDISSAAFFLVAGAIVPGSRVAVRGVNVNPTRTGILDALESMGARVDRADVQASTEPTATLTVGETKLSGATIAGPLIPRLIDEMPALAVAAAVATGVTEIRDAAELRVKESDRVAALARELGKMGARLEERPDGLRIAGGAKLRGTHVESGGDHRIAMALAVAGLVARGETIVEDTACIATSFPDFAEALNLIAGGTAVTVEP
ncbi:MAG: 3-phosphoshikimate 1-carboxyvinyltransferase [Candidatus Rokuibacteriota bacterium]|nr:MAG: 3-phosphoshikimate 1-carboxyvinyltransferase [Candidatus Rokubacteria bacterium]